MYLKTTLFSISLTIKFCDMYWHRKIFKKKTVNLLNEVLLPQSHLEKTFNVITNKSILSLKAPSSSYYTCEKNLNGK